jgi:ferrous iron transport protein A
MDGSLRSVATMKPGEVGTVIGFSDDFLSVKLMEMGCLPGSTILFNFAAPLGDPICISVSGYELTLRIEEAVKVNWWLIG